MPGSSFPFHRIETKGFGRHRGDFYRQHDRHKKLWLKAFGREAEALLRAPELPEAYRAGTASNEKAVRVAWASAEIRRMRAEPRDHFAFRDGAPP